MENLIKTGDPNPEKRREVLAEIVKQNLEKYMSEIKNFSLMTCSVEANGCFSTNNSLPPLQYDSRYDTDYKFFGLPKTRNYIQEGKSGYVAMPHMNYYTFVGALGRALHTPDRPGNSIVITLIGEKGKLIANELIESISNLIATIKLYENGDKYKDIKNIVAECLPVLEAFEDCSKKFPSRGQISITGLIAEYKELLLNLPESDSN